MSRTENKRGGRGIRVMSTRAALPLRRFMLRRGALSSDVGCVPLLGREREGLAWKSALCASLRLTDMSVTTNISYI